MNGRISQVIADLYRGSRDIPYDSFQEWALDQLGDLIEFDAAWWGRCANDPLMIHQVHLYHCAPTLPDDYAPWIGVDFFREEVCAKPGVTASTSNLMPREELEATSIYREFGLKHRVEWSLGTVLIEPVSSLNEFITVWRKDKHRPFSETDRSTKELLMPHLVEAFRNCRLLYLHENNRRDRASSWALCDEHGILVDVHRQFVTLLVKEWPGWRSARLPRPLLEAVASKQPFLGKQIAVMITPLSGLRFLEARNKGAVDTLSRRERQVVDHYARGRSHAQIAATLDISPSTVRNLISRAFRKLHVNNKAELAARLRG